MSGSEVDAEACLLAAIEWAREGGRMIKEAWDRSLSGAESDAVAVEFKGTIDLVTEVDKAVETLITRKIGERFPQHAILGEEAAAEQGHYTLGDEPTWCIDPIDGTTNFVHHFPFSCVSIGLCVNKRSLLGVVYNPILEELFTAREGHGAFLNGRRLRVSACERIDQAVISTNVGYIRKDDGIDFILENMRVLLQKNVRSMRSLGSSACEVCSVACGRLDAFYEFGIHAWDIAAAVCILQEAGGVAVDPSGAPLDLTSRRVLAAAPGLVSPIVALLNTNPPFLPSFSP